MPARTRKGKKIVVMSSPTDGLTPNEIEMDYRVKEAVKAALHKAKVCKKPIARYDSETKKSYIEYPDGTRKYAR